MFCTIRVYLDYAVIKVDAGKGVLWVGWVKFSRFRKKLRDDNTSDRDNWLTTKVIMR